MVRCSTATPKDCSSTAAMVCRKRLSLRIPHDHGKRAPGSVAGQGTRRRCRSAPASHRSRPTDPGRRSAPARRSGERRYRLRSAPPPSGTGAPGARIGRGRDQRRGGRRLRPQGDAGRRRRPAARPCSGRSLSQCPGRRAARSTGRHPDLPQGPHRPHQRAWRRHPLTAAPATDCGPLISFFRSA